MSANKTSLRGSQPAPKQHSEGVRSMSNRFPRTIAAAVAAIGLAQPALAVLDSVGPVDPVHGYPQWYMDRNGLALELCVNSNATVLAAGGCVILPAAPPDGVQTVPEVFPTNWAMEHFYTLASAKITSAGLNAAGTPAAGAGKVTFTLSLEGSFATPAPAQGQQITFNRWRVFHANPPCSGSYTYYTPNNAPQTFATAAGTRVFETSDIGVGTFAGPLSGTTGPFLLPSATPGGTPTAPFVGPDGKRYIQDYNLVAGTAVTGSTLPNPLRASTKAWIPADIKAMPFANYMLIEGPGIATGNCAATESVSTTNAISLFGRYFDGAIASPSRVDRATFTAVDTNNDGTPDSFVVGVWASAQQRTGGALPALGMSLVTGDPAAPTSVTAETAMTRFQLGASVPGVLPKFEYFQSTTAARQLTGPVAAQSRPAAGTARVRVTTDTPVTVLNVPLVDELFIREALWDSSLRTLTVVAESGAYLAAASPASQNASNLDCASPCLTIDSQWLPKKDAAGVDIDFKMKSQAGSKYAIMSAVIPNVTTPPETVTVLSSAGGSDTKPVMYAGVPTGTGLLVADSASTPMNVAVTIPVLANDVGVSATPGLQICTAAAGGTCRVPVAATACVANTLTPECTPSGGRISISADNRVVFTPKANVGGTSETFWYLATTASGALRAPVTVAVGSVSGLPDARDDLGVTVVVGKVSPVDILANDFAPAGVNLASLRLLSGPCQVSTGTCLPGAATFDALGRLVLTLPAAGQWSMQYTFTDAAGVTADPGVVNVNAVASEQIIVQRARWIAPKTAADLGSVDANGTSSIALGQVLELRLPNAATGPVGCNNPTAGTRIAVTTVPAGGAWSFNATALQTRPATVYVYSPTYGGCTDATVQ